RPGVEPVQVDRPDELRPVDPQGSQERVAAAVLTGEGVIARQHGMVQGVKTNGAPVVDDLVSQEIHRADGVRSGDADGRVTGAGDLQGVRHQVPEDAQTVPRQVRLARQGDQVRVAVAGQVGAYQEPGGRPRVHALRVVDAGYRGEGGVAVAEEGLNRI